MTSAATQHALWDRVVCGIDGTPASLDAAHCAARLMPAASRLTLCTVVDPSVIDRDASSEQRLTRQAEAALDEAERQVGGLHDAELHLREGNPVRMLLEELRAERATLVAVGSNGDGRAGGVALGSVTTSMLHQAPCSVLVSHGRPHQEPELGGEIVVGFDGSGGARRALAAGRQLSERLQARLHVIVALGGAITAPELPWLSEDLEDELTTVTEDSRPPVEALAEASRSAALVILGSRHLPGILAALASVSERTAHRTICPALIVR